VTPTGNTRTTAITVNTITDNPTGYKTTLSTNSSTETCLRRPTDGTNCSNAVKTITASPNLFTNPNTLGINNWGATLAGAFTKPDVGDDAVWFGVPNITSPALIKNSDSSTTTSGEPQTITIGTRVNHSIPATNSTNPYTNTLVFTSVANAYTATPTITSITPSSGSPTATTNITINGTNFSNAYQVFIDKNNNADQDSGEACQGANIVSASQITCQLPTNATETTYDVVVKTWGGATKTAIGTTVSTADNYIYKIPTPTPPVNGPTSQWVKASTELRGDSADDIIVDLDANMIPVVNSADYNANNSVEWASYDMKKWANAVTVTSATLDDYKEAPVGTVINESDILGYFTYVPRYAYEVQRRDRIDLYLGSPVLFDIRFEKSTTNKKTPAPTCSTATSPVDYRTGCSINNTYPTTAPYNDSTWATHPAFSFGGTELNGIWVTKYEMTNTAALPMSKPYISSSVAAEYTSLIGQNVATQFATAQTVAAKHNLTNQTESYMWKSSTWGAVAYLSDSNYGRGISMLNRNSSSNFWAGCYNNNCSSNSFYTTNGVGLSTTNNVYGVYDLNGNASENTMAVYDSMLASSGFTTLPAAKYLDVFTKPPFGEHSPASNDVARSVYNWNVCTWELCGGHALHEVLKVQLNAGDRQAWDNNTTWFVEQANPWQYRGYPYNYSHSDGGLWCTSQGSGSWTDHTFRTVLSRY
jgi:hypothetical protein